MTNPTPNPPIRSRAERRLTVWLKLLLTIALAAFVFSGVLDFLGRIRSVTVILIGAVFFTYVIYPVVRRLHARMPLGAAIAVVYAVLALLVIFGMAVVVPALADDVQSLIHAYPTIVHNAQTTLADPSNPLVRKLPEPVRLYLGDLPAKLGELAERYGGEAASRALSILLSTFAVLATVVVIPVISIYLLFEAPDLMQAAMNAIPPRARPKAAAVLHDLDEVLGGFIRGQLLVGATIGTLITLVLLVFKVKYGVLIGVAAGLFDVIPYVGALVAFVPATLIALFNDGWQHALIIALLFVVIFQLEGHFIAPRIVSESVGLSPLLVIVAILIGGELAGIGGMFLAVPIAGLLKVLALHVMPQYPPAIVTPPPPVISDVPPALGQPAPVKPVKQRRAGA
jgi:predicted PurR-regulated permease PerM